MRQGMLRNMEIHAARRPDEILAASDIPFDSPCPLCQFRSRENRRACAVRAPGPVPRPAARPSELRKHTMSTPSIVIASAGRTAVGSFNGAFANTPAHEMGAAVISAVLERAGVAAEEVDEVILGQVLQAGEGQNPARQAAIKAGLRQEATAWGMNQLCGSGLRAVALGMQQIATGDAGIIVAGGMESMSMAPHCAH